MKKRFSIPKYLVMALIILGAIGRFSPIRLQAAETGVKSDHGEYLTRLELVQIIAKETGEKEGTISELMFSRGLNKPATMADLIEILFQSNLLKEQIEGSKLYLNKPIKNIYK